MYARLILILPLVLFLGVTYFVPFIDIARLSVTMPDVGLHQYQTALGDPLILDVFVRTLRICLGVTLLSVVAAYGVTFLWVRGSAVTSSLVELCVMIPFWISVLTRAFGWLSMLSNRGVINTWLTKWGIVEQALPLVRNEFGVVVGMAHYLIPFAVFPLATAMRNIDERVLMAAQGMGASRARVFWQVFVPMTASGLLGALLLVFVFSIGFYITPSILGGGKSVMMAELIYLRIFQIPDWGLAAAMSVILMVCVGGLLVVLIRRYAKVSQ